jgi:hypothetical protein
VNADPNILGARFRGNPIRQQGATSAEQAEASRLAAERLSSARQRDVLEAIPKNQRTRVQEAELTRLRREVVLRSEALGDQAGRSFVQSRFGNQGQLRLRWPPAGKPSTPGDFDQVWELTRPDGTKRYIVVEAKGGSSSLGTRMIENGSREAEQGNPRYFRDIAGVMSNPNASTQSQRVGQDLQRALSRGQVEYWEVRAPINGRGQSTDVQAREFDLTPRP